MTEINESGRIDFPDFAKGMAIIGIVLLHCFLPLPESFLTKASNFGGSGVHLFIFLSGFGLILGRKLTAGNFYIRRLHKILLPYFLIVTLMYITDRIISDTPTYSTYSYLSHIFLFKMFDEKAFISFGYHFWFMSTIIQFYLIYPLLVYLITKTGLKRFLIISFITSIIWWIFLSATGLYSREVLSRCFLSYLWEFSLGMVFAELYKQRNYQFWKLLFPVVVIVTSIAMMLSYYLAVHGGAFGRTWNDIPAFLGYAGITIIIFRTLGRFEYFRGLVNYIGRKSYSTYLTHGLVIAFAFAQFAKFGYRPNMEIVPFLFSAIIIFAFLFDTSYHFIISSLNQAKLFVFRQAGLAEQTLT